MNDSINYVILGSTGQLGYELSKKLITHGNLLTFSRKELDITDYFAVKKMIYNVKPKIIINASAYTSVDQAEINKELAYKVNSNAVENIAKLLSDISSYLIHYSTDYVFDGQNQNPYTENDQTCPINTYGESKLEGEIKIEQNMKNFYILRTSWVIGKNGKNFARNILKQAKSKNNLRVVNDQFGVPTSTSLLTKVTSELVHKIRFSKELHPGIYHLTPNGKTNWYEISKIILKVGLQEGFIDRKKEINIDSISSSELLYTAKRPRNSMLNTSKIKKILSFNLPNWEDDINNTFIQITQNLKNEA